MLSRRRLNIFFTSLHFAPLPSPVIWSSSSQSKHILTSVLAEEPPEPSSDDHNDDFHSAYGDSITEFFQKVDEFVDHVPEHMTFCQFGLPAFHELLSWNVMARLKPPRYKNVYLHFFDVDENNQAFQRLNAAYPGYVNRFQDVESFDSFCSMIVISLHYPYVSFEDISTIAKKIPSIFLAYFKTDCNSAQLECRWMSKSWEAILGDGSYCGQEVCLGMVPSDSVFDEVQAQNPMVECSEFMDKY